MHRFPAMLSVSLPTKIILNFNTVLSVVHRILPPLPPRCMANKSGMLLVNGTKTSRPWKPTNSLVEAIYALSEI